MAPRLLYVAVVAVAVALACSLQGCHVEPPTHDVGAWRSTVSYLTSYEFIAAGKDASEAVINSCSVADDVVAAEQCSGHGWCMPWNNDQVLTLQAQGLTPLAFCSCDPEWADPECRTKRKSQVKAFLYSLFLGFLGADQFYLGYGFLGCLKFLSLGGFGFWWFFDIIRIGSAPVYSLDPGHRLYADLPHYSFVLAFGTFCCFLGFTLALLSAAQHRSAKRKEQMLRSRSEEIGAYASNAASAPLWRGASGYGSGSVQRTGDRAQFVDL